MLLCDFDFDLPPNLIAQTPRPRGASRLLVVDRVRRDWRETTFGALPSLFARGDLLVVNDSRVFPARLIGRRDPSGGAVECLLLEREPAADTPPRPGDGDTGGNDDGERAAIWQALMHPGQKLKPGARFVIEDASRAPGVAIHGEVLERLFFGRRRVRLEARHTGGGAAGDEARGAAASPSSAPALDAAIDRLGHVPLPPYIARPDTADDRERYQTIYARARGSIAAPTAGLHFDAATLAALDAAGVARTAVTLHVGYGTFKPVRVENVAAHRVDAERYDIPAAAASAIAAARAAGRRVVAVGTTTTRALEHAAIRTGRPEAGPGVADLFIYPGHEFKVVDALVTNFHLPRSSLLMLVCAFAGRDLVLEAYRDAVARGFLFYSYGDAMVVV